LLIVLHIIPVTFSFSNFSKYLEGLRLAQKIDDSKKTLEEELEQKYTL